VVAMKMSGLSMIASPAQRLLKLENSTSWCCDPLHKRREASKAPKIANERMLRLAAHARAFV